MTCLFLFFKRTYQSAKSPLATLKATVPPNTLHNFTANIKGNSQNFPNSLKIVFACLINKAVSILYLL